jgi:hypothetical protein
MIKTAPNSDEDITLFKLNPYVKALELEHPLESGRNREDTCIRDLIYD